MTYSHNSVSNNLKMTTATAATAAAASTIRTKNVSHGGGGSGNSPPSTPSLSAHSNSIASSTNYQQQQQQQQQLILSSSPPGCPMSSGASTTSNCSSSSSISSLGSAGNGSGGYFGSARKQQRNRQQQRRSPQQQAQHQPLHYQQAGSANKRYGGSGQKQHDGQRSPQGQVTRQSPASVLGGGLSVLYNTPTGLGHNTARKPRSKHTSPLVCVNGNGSGGKISPTIPLIPTALTHFAGSKCFDAPAPTALPKPPEHWTLNKSEENMTSSAGPSLQSVINARYNHQRHHHHHHHHNHNSSGSSISSYAMDAHTYGGHVVKSSKRNLLDDFDTHNLKLLLNVQS